MLLLVDISVDEEAVNEKIKLMGKKRSLLHYMECAKFKSFKR